MNRSLARNTQRGATLIVALIMLVLITLLVSSGFALSASNLQAVGNMQNRNEAIAAANKAIEQVLSSPFTAAPAAESIDVDIDYDGSTDYQVDFDKPACISASRLANTISVAGSSITLGSAFAGAQSDYYQTLWDLHATVVDSHSSGASVNVRQGVRVLLTQLQYNAVCGP